ncbi:MAG: hypothetical protein GKR89_05935 [Candidatus Latescibacteria bacterium]|nr:hypothetical protein [Candidatus Latescibacterota bacterium]
MIEKLLNLDRRYIFIFVFLGVGIPLLLDFSFPIKPEKHAQAIYDQIERVGDKKGTVLLSFSYGPSTVPELQPMALSLLRHCFRRDINVVAICMWPDAPGLAQQALEEIAAEFDKQEGIDYAFMGYKPGFQNVILNMGQDFHSTFPQDAWGASSDTLAATRNIHSLKDFDFIFDLAAGSSIDQMWIPFGQEKYKFPLGAGCTAVIAPDLYPYIQSGQIVGLLGGLSGAAQYEAIIGKPGEATKGMRPQSVTHLIMIAFILLGNTMYFLSRRSVQTAANSQ